MFKKNDKNEGLNAVKSLLEIIQELFIFKGNIAKRKARLVA